MKKNWDLESIKVALEYAKLCAEQIEKYEFRIESKKQKLKEAELDRFLISVEEEEKILKDMNKLYKKMETKKEELKQQLDFVNKHYSL